MIRQSTDPRSKNVMTAISPGNSASFQRRSASGGSTVTTSTAASVPGWVRLVRTGNIFTSYVSANGSSWSVIGAPVTLAMNEKVYVGLAVSSHSSNSLCTTTMTDVSMSSPGTSSALITSRQETTNALDVYPNPIHGNSLRVRLNSPVNATLQILNTLGKIVYERILPEESLNQEIEIDMSGSAAGVYLVKVSDKTNVSTRTIVKQ